MQSDCYIFIDFRKAQHSTAQYSAVHIETAQQSITLDDTA